MSWFKRFFNLNVNEWWKAPQEEEVVEEVVEEQEQVEEQVEEQVLEVHVLLGKH